MTNHDKRAVDLADKIVAKAEESLASIEREMIIMKWPAEFRAIMWGTVADIASKRADEARRAHQQFARI